jgi:hypothetical protein
VSLTALPSNGKRGDRPILRTTFQGAAAAELLPDAARAAGNREVPANSAAAAATQSKVSLTALPLKQYQTGDRIILKS